MLKHLVVPYHHAEPLTALAQTPSDDIVVVSKGPAGAMVARILEQTAARVAATPEPLLVTSGDDITALATITGLQRRGVAPGGVWLSARAGMHTAHTTRSGDLDGMAVAMLTGRAGTSLTQTLGLRPLADRAVALAGTRAVDDAERAALAASHVAQLDLAALAAAPLPAGPWYVHVDVDLADPAELPPLRAPAPGGPSLDAVAAAVRTLASRGAIAAVGLACTFTTRAFADAPLERIAALATAARL